MAKITLTAKRQATLPKALCEELGVGPGDRLELERRSVRGEVMWLVRSPGPDWSWVGAGRRFARGKSHDMGEVRKSIARGISRKGMR